MFHSRLRFLPLLVRTPAMGTSLPECLHVPYRPRMRQGTSLAVPHVYTAEDPASHNSDRCPSCGTDISSPCSSDLRLEHRRQDPWSTSGNSTALVCGADISSPAGWDLRLRWPSSRSAGLQRPVKGAQWWTPTAS